jgi:hypothetical protein
MRVSLGGGIGRSDAEALETGRRSMLLDLRERFACMTPQTRLAG